ncbi:hypothetical protein ABTY61_02685 [Kitasatospora sp. NPDC096128]|uniref:hypothetical protein n=1 Tax=Kitasatospora sp. NPDC096128 TaxID=3155547 RepID=UPI003316796C
MPELDPTGVLPWDDAALPAPPAPVPPTLPWEPARGGAKVVALTDAAEPHREGFDLGRFATWLRDADVLDQGPIELPGATVTLPYGMRIIRRFNDVVAGACEQAGFEEFDYPMLVPDSVLEPTREIMPLKGSLLYAGSDEDWAAGRKRMVLTPTGEGAVYSHWAKMVRSRRDLPIRAYRKARYFRPARAGRSVFRAIEAQDIYEFQACYADRADALEGFEQATVMARKVGDRLHVPVLWSTRPPWTNNTQVSDRTIGGDVALPHGATLQVGCLYDQAQRFSRLYGVGFREGAEQVFTHHVTGALTRRLVLTHLMLGMDSEGELLLHPDLAPVQIALTLAGDDTQELADARELAARLTARGVRCELRTEPDRRAVGRLHKRWRRQGVPLRVYLQARRDAGDRTRAVVVRADTREEAVLLPAELTALADVLPGALAEVGNGYLRRAWGFAQRQCRTADSASVRQILTERAVAVAPLEASEEAVDAVSQWRLGEVLGFRRAPRPAPCVVTGRTVTTVAYLSPRT